jgi:NAD(P)H-quinone oxidoreductase subunit 5
MTSPLLSVVTYGTPALFALAGLIQLGRWKDESTHWRTALPASLAAFSVSLVALLFATPESGFVRPVTMLLITTLACVLVSFSKTYLSGLKGQARYLSAFFFTLAGVTTVVAANHLGMLVLAWSASSLFLHRLLTFFEDRPFALLAAHKKFIVSRLAELCLVVFLFLISRTFGTLDISEVSKQIAASSELPLSAHFAGALLATAVILKTAQLPLHGWILQVMEAPTPVSALLHAGVVNLGGYVLIQMAALVSAVPAAQILLVGFGCTTAVLAGLVSMTRVTIKVRLAWSTCAQMGFMLVQCGLGFYGLALVHLLAHSLYKAHAFLSCGDVVRKTSVAQLTNSPIRVGLGGSLLAAGLGIAALIGISVAMSSSTSALWDRLSASSPFFDSAQLQTEFLMHSGFLVIAGLALTPLLVNLFSNPLKFSFVSLTQALVVAGVSVFFHFQSAHFFGLKIPQNQNFESLHRGLLAAVILSFFTLFLVQWSIFKNPKSSISRVLHPWIYGGFFVDEIFTRVTNNLWKPRSLRSRSWNLNTPEMGIEIPVETKPTKMILKGEV